MTELNPNHAVTRALHDQWHKLAALAVFKAGGHVVITADDIAGIPDGLAMTVRELDDGIHLQLIDPSAAMLLAKAEGGLPT